MKNTAKPTDVRDAPNGRRFQASIFSGRLLVKRGSRAVRVLNAILAPKLASDPELSAAWENAKRLKEPAGGRPALVPAEPPVEVVRVA